MIERTALASPTPTHTHYPLWANAKSAAPNPYEDATADAGQREKEKEMRWAGVGWNGMGGIDRNRPISTELIYLAVETPIDGAYI
ncbi:hypothetical protein LIA77_06663 [Sarocladium implicatum]|nr:hypothetical protein LIA77_06663 [Sarocladium implicatum]